VQQLLYTRDSQPAPLNTDEFAQKINDVKADVIKQNPLDQQAESLLNRTWPKDIESIYSDRIFADSFPEIVKETKRHPNVRAVMDIIAQEQIMLEELEAELEEKLKGPIREARKTLDAARARYERLRQPEAEGWRTALNILPADTFANSLVKGAGADRSS
jgi:hypothetical protein